MYNSLNDALPTRLQKSDSDDSDDSDSKGKGEADEDDSDPKNQPEEEEEPDEDDDDDDGIVDDAEPVQDERSDDSEVDSNDLDSSEKDDEEDEDERIRSVSRKRGERCCSDRLDRNLLTLKTFADLHPAISELYSALPTIRSDDEYLECIENLKRTKMPRYRLDIYEDGKLRPVEPDLLEHYIFPSEYLAKRRWNDMYNNLKNKERITCRIEEI